MTHTSDRIEDLLQTGARNEVYPGAVWAVGDADGILASGAVGLLDPDRPSSSATSPNTSPAIPWTSWSPNASGTPWA